MLTESQGDLTHLIHILWSTTGELELLSVLKNVAENFEVYVECICFLLCALGT